MDIKNTFLKLKQTAADTASTVAQSAKEGTASVAKKSNELIEVSKLTLCINSEEAKTKDFYAEIGKKVYAKYENGVYIDPDVVDECEHIRELKSNVNYMKAKIQKVKDNSNT